MSAGGLREAGFRPPRFGQSEAGSGRKQSSGPLETSCRAIRYRNPPCVLRREGLCRRVRGRRGNGGGQSLTFIACTTLL